MQENELLSYIKIAQKAGQTKNQITTALINNGWDKKTIESAFSSNENRTSPVPSPPKAKKAGWVSGWDAFEHTLMFVSLLFASSSFALIIHAYVDKLIPPLPARGYSFFSYLFYSSYFLTGALATLIITFPLFAYLHLDIVRRTKKNPLIRSLKARKIFIYLTLFISFIIMIKKLIQTVYALLQGNFTSNFIFHLVVTITISGTIFFYYLYQVKEDRKSYA